ncbi:MAG TPA: Fe-S cluster assembly protein SufE [Gammaproteobacteria bacterium]|jgi:cysteine desulfuration protein SufE|nr:Fe-S cluster assembly protein SufE [Gammaproteobacteria bacterium]
MTLDELKETFAFLDSWEDKYRLVIDLGKEVPALPAADRTEDHLVRGCQSQVWLVTRYDPATDRLHMALDSDAHIVRGLIAIVLAAYADRSPREILEFDIEGLFRELDLVSHLSPTRGNGLRAMVARIRQAATNTGT